MPGMMGERSSPGGGGSASGSSGGGGGGGGGTIAEGATGTVGVMPVDVLETYGNFVLNIKVLGSDAGVGVPTLPVRIPQIVDSSTGSNQLSFEKLVEIVIMIASSQSGAATSSPTGQTVIQHHVYLSFPNPQTKNTVLLTSAHDLLQVMNRYKHQQQVTLIAKVQHQIVPKPPTPTKLSTSSSPRSPIRKPSLPTTTTTTSPVDPAIASPPKEDKPKPLKQQHLQLQFDPPKFHLEPSPLQGGGGESSSNTNTTLVSLMEQLLEIQSNRMEIFANHMEDRFQAIIEEKMITSKSQLKQCIKDTVKLVVQEDEDDDGDDDGSVSIDDYDDDDEDKNDDDDDKNSPASIRAAANKLLSSASEPRSPSKLSTAAAAATPATAGSTVTSTTSNLEKIVKDQMVSMELRFSKLEEQSKYTAALAKFPSTPSRSPSPPSASDKRFLQDMQTKMDSRFENMEKLILMIAGNNKAAAPAATTVANIKTPQPPDINTLRTTISNEALFLPKFAGEPQQQVLPPPPPPPTTTTNEEPPPASPPTDRKNSLLFGPPPLAPHSPVETDSRRDSTMTASSEMTDYSIDTRRSSAFSTGSITTEIITNTTSNDNDNDDLEETPTTAGLQPQDNDDDEQDVSIDEGSNADAEKQDNDDDANGDLEEVPTTSGLQPRQDDDEQDVSIDEGSNAERQDDEQDVSIDEGSSGEEENTNTNNSIDDSARTAPRASDNDAAAGASTITTPLQTSPVDVPSSTSGYSTMPSLADISASGGGGGQRKKTSVREMFMATTTTDAGAKNDEDSSSSSNTQQKKKRGTGGKSLPILFPMLDISSSTISKNELSTPPTTKGTKTPSSLSAFTSPSAIQPPPLFAASPSSSGKSPSSSQLHHHHTASEMKQAAKDHIQSMESRVSKLREINKQATPATTATTLTPATTATTTILTSPRTLFPPDSDDSDDGVIASPTTTKAVERVLTKKMNSLTESLQSTIEGTTKASVDTKMADMEALLQRKLQQIQKVVTIATTSSSHHSERSSSTSSKPADNYSNNIKMMQESLVEQLTDLLQTNQEKLVQELVASKTLVEVVEGDGGSASASASAAVPGLALLKQLQSVLDKRMDNIETLVQLTATELEANTKAANQRLNQKLLEQVTEVIQNQMPPGEDSIATSAFPTVYGDDDQSVEVQDQDGADTTREDPPQQQNDNTGGGGGVYRRGRSLEADLVAMDREASIRDIYGEMDIDDDDMNSASTGDLPTHSSRGNLGRGKSLRDVCSIDTIEEEDGEETDDVSDPGTIQSTPSEISARSASVRHIYGENSVDIDDDHDDDDDQEGKAPDTTTEGGRGYDTPPVMARRSVSSKTVTSRTTISSISAATSSSGASYSDEDEQEEEVEADRKPWLTDRAEAAMIDRPPASRTSSASSDSKDRAPSLVSRAVSKREIYGEPEIDAQTATGFPQIVVDRAAPAPPVTGESNIKKNPDPSGKDRAPSIVSRAVSTREIYGEPEIDAETAPAFPQIVVDGAAPAAPVTGDSPVEKNADPDGIKQDKAPSLASRAVSTRAIYGEPEIDVDGPPGVPEMAGDRAGHNSDLNEILEGRGSLVDRAVSTRALGGPLETDDDDSECSSVAGDSSDLPDILDIYDGLDIDANDGMSVGSQNAEDIYDELSLDGVDETHAFVSELERSDSDLGSELDELEEEEGEEDEQDSVSIDGASVAISLSSGYESDSSREDEEYFHDHARQHLTVLATSMAKVRAAKKATSRYTQYQDHIFLSRRDGPLAVKVKSDDAHEVGEKATALPDDESSGEESEEQAASEQGMVTDSSDEDGPTDSAESEQRQRNRSKASAFIVAMAVTDRRVANRGIRLYRELLRRKFTPRKRKGPMALTEQSESSAGVRDDRSASEASVEDETEPKTTISVPSIDDTEDDAMSIPSSDKNEPKTTISLPSIDAEGEDEAMSIPSIDTAGGIDDSGKNLEPVSNPTSEVNSGFVFDAFNIGKPETGIPRLESVDSCWKKQLKDDESSSERSSPPPAYSAAHIEGAGRTRSPPSPPRAAESGQEEGTFKPENLPKAHPPPRMQQSQANQGRKRSWKPFDESDGNIGEEKEMEEWEAVAPIESDSNRGLVVVGNAGESKSDDDPIEGVIVEHIRDMKAQMQKWEEIFLVSNQNQRATNSALQTANKSLQVTVKESNDALQISVKESNESLKASIQESIEDSHQFAAYLDRMLTARIDQLEQAIIRSQQGAPTAASTTQPPLQQQGIVQNEVTSKSTAAAATPPRWTASSAPTSPLNHNWTGPPAPTPPSTSRAIVQATTNATSSPSRGNDNGPPQFSVVDGGGESKEAEHEAREMEAEQQQQQIVSVSSMAVEVTEWKRLQDQLRGTEEVAEGYRKQVLQLRNVLEVKINEGNASQHQVEILQRKLQDAHDREIQAQKQLRPVTRRVEQVIQEMVLLEEHSANLQVENGRLREQLWMAQREF